MTTARTLFSSGAVTALSILLVDTARAQHPAPIPISAYNPSTWNAGENRILDAKLSPDGLWVAYTYVNGTSGSYTTTLGLRRADGSSTSTTVVNVESTSTPYPPASFTWRWNGQANRLLFIDTPSTGGTFVQLKELDPNNAPIAAVTRFAVQSQDYWYLQVQPCGNVVSGTRLERSGSFLNRIWTANLSGTGTVTPTTQVTTTDQLLALDVSPNGANALYRRSPSSAANLHYSLDIAAGASTPVLVNSAYQTVNMAGYIDNSTTYGVVRLNSTAPLALVRYDITGVTNMTNSAFLDLQLTGTTIEPAHLGGSGTKEMFSSVMRDTGSSSPNAVRMLPVANGPLGGDISLAETAYPWAEVFAPSMDCTGAHVAYIAEDAYSQRQVFVVPTNREVRATVSHPIGAGNVTYETTVPGYDSEISLLYVSTSLVPAVPFGTPGAIELDPATAVSLATQVGNATATFQIGVNPSLLGMPFYYQGFRFDSTSSNTTRVARVKYY